MLKLLERILRVILLGERIVSTTQTIRIQNRIIQRMDGNQPLINLRQGPPPLPYGYPAPRRQHPQAITYRRRRP